MVEVRELALGERPNGDADHILIEPTPSGQFAANGSAAGRRGVTFWSPPAFDSVDEAISQARIWADQNEVSLIYVVAGADKKP